MSWICPIVRWLRHSSKKIAWGLWSCIYLKESAPYWNGSISWTVFLQRIRSTVLIFQIRKEICKLFVIYLGSLDLGHEILSSSLRAILKNDVASQVDGKYVHPENLNVVRRRSSVISIHWPSSNFPFQASKSQPTWNILQCAKHLCAPFRVRVKFARLNVFLIIYIVWKTNVHR